MVKNNTEGKDLGKKEAKERERKEQLGRKELRRRVTCEGENE